MSGCFHCGQPIPVGVDLSLVVHGQRRPMCCPGCLAVAELIEEQGLARFYEFRSAPSVKPRERGRGATASEWSVCDRPEVAARLAPRRRQRRERARLQSRRRDVRRMRLAHRARRARARRHRRRERQPRLGRSDVSVSSPPKCNSAPSSTRSRASASSRVRRSRPARRTSNGKPCAASSSASPWPASASPKS